MRAVNSAKGQVLATIFFVFGVSILKTTPVFGYAAFMLDVEGNSATPGAPGGKAVAISTTANVSLNFYALFQGDSGIDTDYAIRAASAWFRSSTGGLLGNLSAATTGNFVNANSQSGTQNDVDGDGDYDIGGTFAFPSHFSGTTAFSSTNYGFGVGLGTADGTISAATAHSINPSLSATGDGWAYALVGVVTFTPLSVPANASTTITAITIASDIGGDVGNADSAQDIGIGTGAVSIQGRYVWALGNRHTSDILSASGVVITVVPEPAAIVLAGMGALGFLTTLFMRHTSHAVNSQAEQRRGETEGAGNPWGRMGFRTSAMREAKSLSAQNELAPEAVPPRGVEPRFSD